MKTEVSPFSTLVPSGFWTYLTSVAGLVGAYIAGVGRYRGATAVAVKESQELAEKRAEGWHGLSQIKSEELESVLGRLQAAETQIEKLTRDYKRSLSQNRLLRKENLRLHKESAELRTEVAGLRARVTELEREKFERGEPHAPTGTTITTTITTPPEMNTEAQPEPAGIS